MDELFVKQVKKLIETNGRPNMSRNRFKHSLRVLNMCEDIQQHIGGDIDVLRYSALLHDVGWDKTIPHAEVSFNIAKSILSSVKLSVDKKDLILKCILNHSSKDNTMVDLSLEEKILMDADCLDELGCLGIVFSCVNIYRLSMEIDYETILERVELDLDRYKSKCLNQLHLDYSKSIAYSRIRLVEDFIAQMKKELSI